MKKRIAAFIMAVVMTATGNGIPVMAAVDTNAARQGETEDEILLPAANVLDVDFENEDGTDKSEMQNEFWVATNQNSGATPYLSFENSPELNRKVANFFDYAYVYPFNQEKYSKITDAVTVECLFKYNEFWWGEREIISNQAGGGIGLGVDEGGKLTFYAHVGGSYREPKAELRAGEWVHAIGVVDGTSVKLYVNGRLADTVSAEGVIKYPESISAQNFVIGGDSDSNGGVENYSNVSISFARLYDHALTEREIVMLKKKAFEGTGKQVNAGIVASDTAAAGGIMNVNLHVGCGIAEDVDRISYTLAYDPSLIIYCGAKNLMSGVTLDDSTAGILKVDFTGRIPVGDFKNFAKTKIAELDFQAADVDNTEDTVLEIKDFHAYLSDEEVTAQTNSQVENKTITIYGKNALDLNGDGVIGIGDVALAEDMAVKAAIAQEAAIYPYKHAVILTIDGGGNVWNPDEIYYAVSAWEIPQKTRNAEIMEKRVNTYALKLFNEEFATSFTAQAVTPAISAQNYTSILHGVPWGELEEEYQVTNDSTAEKYFPDFGKDTPKYPSVFAAAAAAAPERRYAAFAEWRNILTGIIEPDSPVNKKVSNSKESFQDVANYIKSEEYKNTAIVYMQNDELDHVGHTKGYYTDTYWAALEQLDGWYQSVIDALKETGTYEETLIIANADHGGSKYDHGSIYSTDTDIFIGLGGQTIDSGARLQGGDNSDISALALYGLRMEKPASMTGEVFDSSAFLSQEEMVKKGRDIDCVNFTCTGKSAELYLSKVESDIRATDVVIHLGDAKITNIDVKGGTILRQKEENGELKLTVAYEEQPQVLAELTFEGDVSEDVKVQEIMLGTTEGKEIYADLINKYVAVENHVDRSGLKAVIELAQGLKAVDYTQDSYAVLSQTIADAEAVYEKDAASEVEIQEMITEITNAVSQLEMAVTGTPEYLSLLQELNDKKNALTEAQTTLTDTKKLLEEKEAALGQAQTKVQTLNGELEMQKGEVASLRSELQEAENSLAQLERDASVKDTEIENLKTRIQELQDNIQEIQDAANALETKLSKAQEQLRALETEKAQLEAAKNEAETKVKSAEEEVDAAKTELEQYKAKLEAAQAETKKVQEELEKLKNTGAAIPRVGRTIEVGHVLYRVTDIQKQEAEAYGVSDKALAKVNIASNVTIDGCTFKVKAISANAFKNCKKLKSVTIGTNITSIGKKAFYKCTKLKTIKLLSTKAPKTGKQAFKGIKTKCRITVPKKMTKKQLSTLKARLKKAGVGSKVIFKKK